MYFSIFVSSSVLVFFWCPRAFFRRVPSFPLWLDPRSRANIATYLAHVTDSTLLNRSLLCLLFHFPCSFRLLNLVPSTFVPRLAHFDFSPYCSPLALAFHSSYVFRFRTFFFSSPCVRGRSLITRCGVDLSLWFRIATSSIDFVIILDRCVICIYDYLGWANMMVFSRY